MTSVLVVQMGARRDYELARMLEDRGALAALHTSTAWREGESPSRLYRALSGISDGIIKRRTVRGIPGEKIRTSNFPEPIGRLQEWLGKGKEARFKAEDWALGLSARLRGLGGASIVLTPHGNGGAAFLRWAKGQGAKVATDIIITPRVYEILAEENRRWPGWEKTAHIERNAETYRQHMEAVVGLSDLLLSPSDTVDDGLASVNGFDPAKLVRVPYGLGSASLCPGRPVPRRVLFAGQAALRKGLPYLAEAAQILEPLGYDIRVAGTTLPGIKERSECKALNFLGHLGPDDMAAEFYAADIFCLPSLAEGMASVTLEAFAAGLPCVVTRSAGAPVRDGINGIIVPERDGPAIAEAISSIAEDRNLRERMSEEAVHSAAAHSLDVIGDRLFYVLSEVVNRND